MQIDQAFRIQQLLGIVAEFLRNVENPQWFSISQTIGKDSCSLIFRSRHSFNCSPDYIVVETAIVLHFLPVSQKTGQRVVRVEPKRIQWHLTRPYTLKESRN